ncbi:hypothetical protein, partial [Collinsella sp. LCP21S3_D3]|uniref:hypothetical protein n=1 Tax=Collinsella sp. LCP21S3_D3 TaxID=3438773 RepID=UPI003F8E0E15
MTTKPFPKPFPEPFRKPFPKPFSESLPKPFGKPIPNYLQTFKPSNRPRSASNAEPLRLSVVENCGSASKKSPVGRGSRSLLADLA